MDRWVFAYGSLLWDPGFAPAETVPARLTGWRRRFCLWSIHWRGTEAAPGLVLGLDADATAACDGLALRIQPAEEADVLAALRARELVSDAYDERLLPVALADGRVAHALAYVVRRGHRQYADLSPADQARAIATASGARGPNVDYLRHALRRLDELGIRDPEVEALRDGLASGVQSPASGA